MLALSWVTAEADPAHIPGYSSFCNGEEWTTESETRGTEGGISSDTAHAVVTWGGDADLVAPPGEARHAAAEMLLLLEETALTCQTTESAAVASGAGDPPEPWQAPGGVGGEALAIAAGLILLVLIGGMGVRARRRRRLASAVPWDGFGAPAGEASDRSPPRADSTHDDQESDGHEPELPPDPAGALEEHFRAMVSLRGDQGYSVRNRSLVDKVWSSLRDPFWADPGSGQCGEYAQWGEEWTRGFIHDRVGPDAIVDTIVIEEESTLQQDGVADHLDSVYRANHAATRVILPDGRRYVLDFWDALGRSRHLPPHLQAEADWVERWKAEIGEGVVDRPVDELTLRNYVTQYGPERGYRAFRNSMAEEGKGHRAEVLIRSWETTPW